MWPVYKVCSPSVRELRHQPCPGRVGSRRSLNFELQAFYPSPPMSRRSSFNDHVSQVEPTSASTTTIAPVTSSPPTSTPSAAQPPGNVMQQLHPFSPHGEFYLDRRQSVHLHSLPTAFPAIDYHATQSLPAYAIQPASSTFQLSRGATRRSKQHVQSACVNCKQAHLSCDDHRPCQRCVRRNLDSTCVDVPHRKRGRPRIREQIPNEAAPFALDRRKRPSTALSGQEPTQEEQISSPILSESNIRAEDAFKRPHLTLETDPKPPVAFLDMDFRIAKINTAFQEMFRFLGDLHGQPFERLVDPNSEDSLEGLRGIRTAQLHERDEKNPSYLPPIRNSDDPGSADIPHVDSQDLQNISQGYTTTRRSLQLLAKEGRSVATKVDLCLARTAVIFVVLKLPFLQSPQRPMTSHTATSASSSSANPDTRRSSYTVASQPPDRRLSAASAHSSPTKPFEWTLSSVPPAISPISPSSRQPYPPLRDFPSSSAKSQSTRALHTSPFDSLVRNDPARPGLQYPPFAMSGPETRQRSALTYPTPPTTAFQPPPPTQADDLKLPPISTLGALSVFHPRPGSSHASDVGVNRGRLQSSHEQQTQQRVADRNHREESRDASSQTTDQASHQLDVSRETRKRKRGLDVSDLTR